MDGTCLLPCSIYMGECGPRKGISKTVYFTVVWNAASRLPLALPFLTICKTSFPDKICCKWLLMLSGLSGCTAGRSRAWAMCVKTPRRFEHSRTDFSRANIRHRSLESWIPGSLSSGTPGVAYCWPIGRRRPSEQFYTSPSSLIQFQL